MTAVTCPHCGSERVAENSTVSRRVVGAWAAGPAGTLYITDVYEDECIWETDTPTGTFDCLDCDTLDMPRETLVVTGGDRFAPLPAEPLPRVVVTLADDGRIEVYGEVPTAVRIVDRFESGGPTVIPYDYEEGDERRFGYVFDHEYGIDPGFVARVFDLEPSE